MMSQLRHSGIRAGPLRRHPGGSWNAREPQAFIACGSRRSAIVAQLTVETLPLNLSYSVLRAPLSCESTKMAIPATTTMMMPYSAVVAPLSERRNLAMLDMGMGMLEGVILSEVREAPLYRGDIPAQPPGRLRPRSLRHPAAPQCNLMRFWAGRHNEFELQYLRCPVGVRARSTLRNRTQSRQPRHPSRRCLPGRAPDVRCRDWRAVCGVQSTKGIGRDCR